VLDTVLTHFEMAGILTQHSSTWLSCRVKLLRREEQLAAGHAAQQQAWIRHLLIKKERVWGRISIDLVAAAADLETTPAELAQFLQDLETGGDLLVQPREREETWQLHDDHNPRSPREWSEHFTASTQAHEAASLQRLRQVLDFLTAPSCLTKLLLSHFGEAASDTCGRCARCLHPDRSPAVLPGAKVRTITAAEAARIHKLIQSRVPALRHPRQLTRFLCGLSSPAALRDRLTKHDDYGLLAGIPFDEVLAHCSASMG
jgi:ATP-dependent DNA helicase RecQ